MRRIIPLTLLLLMIAVSCGPTPQVAQGIVTSYDAATKILILRSDLPPDQVLTFSLKKADYGVEPAVGDSVRLAYYAESSGLMALRIMNLSKQQDLKQKGGH